MRCETAHPCCGSRASVRRIRRSKVPCGSSILLAIIVRSFFFPRRVPCYFDMRQYTFSCRSSRGRHFRWGAPVGGDRIPPPRLLQIASAVAAMEFAHEAGEGFDGGGFHGVVAGYAYAADGAVTKGAGESRGRGFIGELFFDGFHLRGRFRDAGDAENDIHLRARTLFDGTAVKAAAGFDGVVKKFGLGVVALLDGGESAQGFNPLENETDNVNRESGGGVIERLFLDVRAVLEERREIFVGALGEIFAEDDDGDTGGAEIFLRASEDEAELFDIDGARRDVGR